MPVKSLTPYLMFDGTAEEALRLYERALGAEIVHLQRFGEINQACGPENAKRVIHAFARIDGQPLMASDSLAGKSEAKGGNVQICLDFEDVEDMTRRFEALAEGGRVIMAPHDAFWGAKWGALVDAFGVHWMFNCATKKP